MNKKLIFLYVLCVATFFGAGVYYLKTNTAHLSLPSFNSPSFTPIPTQTQTASESAEIAHVARVIDGDTIELTDGRKVRYIGIDTPELHHPIKKVQCFGKEAMEMNKELVEDKDIKMVQDVSNVDRYKRLLRYIYVGDVFVNEYLVKEGFASQATFPPDVTYAELFRQAADEARVKKKGLWKNCE